MYCTILCNINILCNDIHLFLYVMIGCLLLQGYTTTATMAHCLALVFYPEEKYWNLKLYGYSVLSILWRLVDPKTPQQTLHLFGMPPNNNIL